MLKPWFILAMPVSIQCATNWKHDAIALQRMDEITLLYFQHVRWFSQKFSEMARNLLV